MAQAMDKRVYGVIGIRAVMANWNADFSGRPKSTSDRRFFGSDKAFKFPMKKLWDNVGEKVLNLKSFKVENGIMQPRDLTERYHYLFGVKPDQTDWMAVLKNLFTAIDVKNFGTTFAVSSLNISITGAVQIGQGFNVYDGMEIEEQEILSPFRNSNEGAKEKTMSTMGTKIVANEAHYMYPFNINPSAYNDYIKMEVTDGYTEDDYAKFRHAALHGATAFSSNSKVGCDNEFALFIETDSEVYLPNLDRYVTFRKEEKDVIELHLEDLLQSTAGIRGVEIYYDPELMEVKNIPDGAIIRHIVSEEEVV